MLRFVVDLFTCRRCGVCEERNKATVEALRFAGLAAEAIVDLLLGKVMTRMVCDHDKPHRGSERLFWDPENHQTMCKPCHDAAKQADEQASLHQRGVWY